MQLKFTKMHGLGNDFVVFDGVRQPVHLTTAQRRRLADRHFGIGCDQILLVEAPPDADVDFRYRIFNADGGEVEQCGNGARCFARFVLDEGLTDKLHLRVLTRSGVIEPRVQPDGRVLVDMGAPRFDPASLPMNAPSEQTWYPLEVDGELLSLGAVSMGNPHVVMLVDDVARARVTELGPALQAHGWFPASVNVGFMQVQDHSHIRLRVYERGAGETLACGTGACAAVVVGIRAGLLDARVDVQLPGGSLSIEWAGNGAPVLMTGPAETVFRGSIDI